MKKFKWITLLIATITSFLLMTGIVLADDISADDWVTNSGNTYVTSGNVGIGTTSPDSKFHVYSPSFQNRLLGISDINLDTTDPWQGAVQIKVGNTGNNWLLNTVSYSVDGKGVRFYNNGGSADRTAFEIAQSGGTRFIVDGTGNVGIGTTTPQSKLAVNGTITSKEVKVTETGWSDFVFEDNYNLPPLTQVESYIKENKHLPDIPSAKQVEEEGLSMAEMMKKQMQKIEELTLYVIEQNKKIENQHNEISALKQELVKMQKNMN